MKCHDDCRKCGCHTAGNELFNGRCYDCSMTPESTSAADPTVCVQYAGGMAILRLTANTGRPHTLELLQANSLQDNPDMVPAAPTEEFENLADAWVRAGQILGWVQ